MNRRSFLAATIAAVVPVPAAPRRIDRSRVSAITDEIARSPADAIAFAHKFGMQWLSLRDIPSNEAKKTSYHELDPKMLQQVKAEFKDAGMEFRPWTPHSRFGLPCAGRNARGLRTESAKESGSRERKRSLTTALRISSSRHPRLPRVRVHPASHFQL